MPDTFAATKGLMILAALAGSRQVGDELFEEIFHPIAERLLERCDAVLRVGGPSQGADLMLRVAEERVSGSSADCVTSPVAPPFQSHTSEVRHPVDRGSL